MLLEMMRKMKWRLDNFVVGLYTGGLYVDTQGLPVKIHVVRVVYFSGQILTAFLLPNTIKLVYRIK